MSFLALSMSCISDGSVLPGNRQLCPLLFPRRVIQHVFPRYLRAPSDSECKPIDQLYKRDARKSIFHSVIFSICMHAGSIQLYLSSENEPVWFNITLTLKRANNDTGKMQEWWIVNQTQTAPLKIRNSKNQYSAGLELYVFSDQVSPPSLGFLAGYG